MFVLNLLCLYQILYLCIEFCMFVSNFVCLYQILYVCDWRARAPQIVYPILYRFVVGRLYVCIKFTCILVSSVGQSVYVCLYQILVCLYHYNTDVSYQILYVCIKCSVSFVIAPWDKILYVCIKFCMFVSNFVCLFQILYVCIKFCMFVSNFVCFPVIYALLPNKSGQTYQRFSAAISRLLRERGGNRDPAIINCDFELAAISPP